MAIADFKIDLPADPDFEFHAVTLSMMSPGSYGAVAALEPEDFHNYVLSKAWTVIQALGTGNQQPDPATVASELEAMEPEPGDPKITRADTAGIFKATSQDEREFASLIDPENVVNRLKGLTMKRKAIWALRQVAENLQDRSYTSVAEDQLGAAVSKLSSLAGNEKRFITLDSLGDSYLRNVRTPVTSTGFPTLDAALAGGFHQHRVYGISGLMKSGKTMLKTSISYNMVENNDPHAYLCLEMRPEEIGQRYYARRMGVNALAFYDEDQRNSVPFNRKLAEAKEWFKSKGALSFRKKPRMDLETLRSTIATIGLSGKYKGVFVDYLQLVGGQRGGENDVKHLDNVAQTLSEMAATYPIWICVGAQQNDDGGVRGGKGLAAACDVLFGFDNSDPEAPYGDASGRRERRHLSMQFSRYTPSRDIGEVGAPGFILENRAGPYFREL